MTWGQWAMLIAGFATPFATYWAGRVDGKRKWLDIGYDRGYERGREDGRQGGLESAYHTAKNALDAPSEGKPGRSIVGRAIVRKLRALAEGTGDAS